MAILGFIGTSTTIRGPAVSTLAIVTSACMPYPRYMLVCVSKAWSSSCNLKPVSSSGLKAIPCTGEEGRNSHRVPCGVPAAPAPLPPAVALAGWLLSPLCGSQGSQGNFRGNLRQLRYATRTVALSCSIVYPGAPRDSVAGTDKGAG